MYHIFCFHSSVEGHAPCNSKVNPIEDEKVLKLKRIGSIAEVVIIVGGVILTGLSMEIQWLMGFSLFVDAILISD